MVVVTWSRLIFTKNIQKQSKNSAASQTWIVTIWFHMGLSIENPSPFKLCFHTLSVFPSYRFPKRWLHTLIKEFTWARKRKSTGREGKKKEKERNRNRKWKRNKKGKEKDTKRKRKGKENEKERNRKGKEYEKERKRKREGKEQERKRTRKDK